MIGGLGIPELLSAGIVISTLLIIFTLGKRFLKKDSNIPIKRFKTAHSVIAIIAILLYFSIKSPPSIFYGQYGSILFGILCAIIASVKYRNPITWFAFGLWFVLASLIVLIFLPKIPLRLCQFCREGVSPDATVCPHCQRDIGLMEQKKN